MISVNNNLVIISSEKNTVGHIIIRMKIRLK
ncbi:hypothetical protein LINPERPRIM_LOCUS28518 [Linum perenne]